MDVMLGLTVAEERQWDTVGGSAAGEEGGCAAGEMCGGVHEVRVGGVWV